ncbi:MAG: DUF4910 domain-containing protein [Candidatus Hodarchaeota archaeon]
MNISFLVETIRKEISEQSIMDMVARISQFHRIQGSKGYLEAAYYIQSILKKFEITSKINEYPADGKWDAWGWIAPLSWDISSGEMWLVKPTKKRLCNYRETPMSVITHSNPVDFVASVVDVGKGDKEEDYKEAKGKVALLTAGPRSIFPLAAKQGVIGLILHPNPERAANIGSTTVQYDGFWPIKENLSDVTAGFSISHKQALELKKLLNDGEDVQVHFKIDTKFYEGKLHVLEAEITGSELPQEEIVLIGHLCHPSPAANDNASGAATLVELMVVLTKLINNGDLEKPKRTIRFLWVPEFSGTIPWINESIDQQKSNRRKIISSLNLDMVGESPAKIGTPLIITRPSLGTPSFLEALLRNIAECVAGLEGEYDKNGRLYHLNFRIGNFKGGSDHLIFNDRYFSIPSTMFNHNDLFHHSNADSIDKVDPLECKSTAIITGATAYGLSFTDDQFLNELSLCVFQDAIADVIKLKRCQNNQSDLTTTQKLKQQELIEKIGIKKLESILELDSRGNLRESIEELIQNTITFFISDKKKREIKQEEQTQNELVNVRIKRNYDGPMSYKRMAAIKDTIEDKKRWIKLTEAHWSGMVLELLNLADNTYTVEEIFLLMKAQFPTLTLDDIIFLVTVFQKEKLLITT